jgi:hypothetical protein
MHLDGPRKAYLRDFTHLIVEVADTAIKAAVKPDPIDYLAKREHVQRLELVRIRRAVALKDRLDPRRRLMFRRDIERVKMVGALALQILDAFRRIESSDRGCVAPALIPTARPCMFLVPQPTLARPPLKRG